MENFSGMEYLVISEVFNPIERLGLTREQDIRKDTNLYKKTCGQLCQIIVNLGQKLKSRYTFIMLKKACVKQKLCEGINITISCLPSDGPKNI